MSIDIPIFWFIVHKVNSSPVHCSSHGYIADIVRSATVSILLTDCAIPTCCTLPHTTFELLCANPFSVQLVGMTMKNLMQTNFKRHHGDVLGLE